MRRCVSGLAWSCLFFAVIAEPSMASLRRCGQVPRKITGFYVDVDPVTTTCGLGRSAAHSFLRRSYVRRSHLHRPWIIHGHSPKTGQTYRFHRVRHGFHHTHEFTTYIGHAGRARLKARFTYPFY